MPLIRFAAGNGRIRSGQAWRIAGDSDVAAAQLHGKLDWEAVRRCLNRSADKLATLAVRQAQKHDLAFLLFDGCNLAADDLLPLHIPDMRAAPGLRWTGVNGHLAFDLSTCRSLIA